MAVRYAVATGNWSDTATWNGGTLPTSADDVYSNGFTVTIDQDVTVLSIRNTAQTPAVAGGGFVVNGTGYVITCTSIITFTISSAAPLLTISGTGTNTFNISINVIPGNLGQNYVYITSTGTVNWVGNLIGSTASGAGLIAIISAVTFNMIGDIYSLSATNFTMIVRIANTATGFVFNLTGNIGENGGIGAQMQFFIIGASGTLNITGNIFSHPTDTYIPLNINNNVTTNIIGTITGNAGQIAIITTQALYLKITGSLISGGNRAVSSSNASAINIFTGPFICSQTGVLPLSVFRMHYFRTLNSYFEFRDETTNGALPPSSPAPATRLVSPDTVVDSPLPSNVRHGISYAFGTFTGTLRVPSPNSVALGVLTDNTVGNAVLTPDAVWDYATANLTDPDSIGARLKNVSTVDTTGEQLEALL